MEKKVTKYKLEDLKSKVCSTTTAIRFQCSYCNSNYVWKISLDNHVKQKHKEMKMNDTLKGSDDSKDQNNEAPDPEVKPKQNRRSPSKRKIILRSKFEDFQKSKKQFRDIKRKHEENIETKVLKKFKSDQKTELEIQGISFLHENWN